MTKTRSRLANSVPEKHGYPSAITTVTSEHATNGSGP